MGPGCLGDTGPGPEWYSERSTEDETEVTALTLPASWLVPLAG